MQKIQTGKLNYLNIAPRKVRLITDTLKNLSVNEAQAQLMQRPNRSAPALLKLLHSTVSNAQNNASLNPEKLVIQNIIVSQGPALTRFRARAQGRGAKILKYMSHVTLILEEKDGVKAQRFLIPKPEKKKPGTKAKVSSKPKTPKKAQLSDEEQKGQDKGLLKKMFRRKSI